MMIVSMRLAPLALVLLAGFACRKGELQPDGGGGGRLSFDATAGDGSGTGDGGPGASDVTPPTRDSNCGAMSSGSTYVPPTILVVLDEATSGDTTKWTGLISALSNLVIQNAVGVNWGLYTFPQAGPACGTGTFTPAIDIAPSPTTGETVAVAIRAGAAGRTGSPTAAAITAVAAYLAALPTDNPKYMMLVTDHAPTCAGTRDPLTLDAGPAQADAIAAITAAAAASIPTMVVAPSTTSDLGALNAMALAGGRPYTIGPAAFYTEATLGDQLMTASRSNNCLFPLDVPPPVPGNVSVTLNGQSVPRDTQHAEGWDYTSSSFTGNGIQLYGEWCTRILAGGTYQITVLYGCPVPVPVN